MNNSKKTALCGVSAALGGIFLAIAKYAPSGKLALFALASVAVMIPLSQKLRLGAILTLIAISLIGFLFGGLGVFFIYLLIFGAHPVINFYLEKMPPRKKAGYVIKLLIKLVYFNAVLFLANSLAYIVNIFPFAIEYYLLAIAVSFIFIPYDIVMVNLQKRMDVILKRYIRF